VQAVISDIHGNLHALEAVLADMEAQGVTEIICLGDIVGYGPRPKECLDHAFSFDVAVRGNHEQALLEQFQGNTFNISARSSIDWTRQQFSMLSADREANGRRWDFLGSLEKTFVLGEIIYVHGSPRDPVNEYVYPRDVYRPEKLESIFVEIDSLCFVGHTHVPGVWTEDMIYLTPEETDYCYPLSSKKTLINVGSVGQPRDRDPRACYVLFEDGAVRFRRVDYPVEKTVADLKSIRELDPYLAERIQEGR